MNIKIKTILPLFCVLSLFSAPLQIQAADCQLAEILPKLEAIQLIPNTGDHLEFSITEEGQMPDVELKVDFVGELTEVEKDCLDQLLPANFDWELAVQYWDGTTKDNHKILANKLGAQRSGQATGDGWKVAFPGKSSQINIASTDFGENFGGGADGYVRVTLHANDQTFTDDLPLQVWAEAVPKTKIKSYLGELKYQLLGYLESKFIHIYNGIPLLNCGDIACSVSDGGFGLMQITDCSGAAGTLSSLPTKPGSNHGFPSYRQIWNWRANADAGKTCFDAKAAYFCNQLGVDSDAYMQCGYSRYNGSNSYGELGITILNETRSGRFRAGWF